MILKRRARTFIDRAAAGAGLLALRERRMLGGLTILMYHRVLPAERCEGYPLATLLMPVEHFRSQVKWLKEHCDVRPVGEAVRELGRRSSHRRPLVSLTFDDGYHDNAEHAASILDEHGLRGTFFVTTGFIETREPMWFDRAASAWMRLAEPRRVEMLERARRASGQTNGAANGHAGVPQWMAALKALPGELRMRLIEEAEDAASGAFEAEQYRPMCVDDIVCLHQSGHEIASHTVTHPILPLVSDDDLANELAASRDTVRRWTGAENVGFCYPNGDVDDRVEQAVRDAGYAYACTTQTGLNRTNTPLTRLARIDISRQRVLDHRGRYDEIAFRSEVCRLRELWRFQGRRDR